MTLGCDWFVKARARLQFDSQQLVLPTDTNVYMFTTKPHCGLHTMLMGKLSHLFA